jgi:hypothetical protein
MHKSARDGRQAAFSAPKGVSSDFSFAASSADTAAPAGAKASTRHAARVMRVKVIGELL